MYTTAAFFADKLVTLSAFDPRNVYMLAQAFYMGKHYRRALALLQFADLVEQDDQARYLAAKCLAEVGNHEECLTMLGEEAGSSSQSADSMGSSINLHSAMCLLRGKAHSAMDNQAQAVTWLKAALKADPFCYEALQMLMDNHMLTQSDEEELLQQLPFRADDTWLRLLYTAKRKKYGQMTTLEGTLDRLEEGANGVSHMDDDHEGNDAADNVIHARRSHNGAQVSTSAADHAATGEAAQDEHMRAEDNGNIARGCGLSGCIDVAVCRVEWLYYMGAYQECYDLSCTVIERDPYALEVMPLHLAAAVELRKKNELFLRSHRLTEEYPEHAVAWFGVGCYYLAADNYDGARRYFGKATAMDPCFAPGWLGFGHAFAAQDESDQAMAAYRTAARRFPGLHQPLIGMGMEYARMNNLLLSEQMLHAAHTISPSDPLVLHELGVMAFKLGDNNAAEGWFGRALTMQSSALSPDTEATVSCLGHVYRKQRRWKQAVAMFEKALGLAPWQANTYAALGFIYHLQGKLALAISNYHKALGLRADDSFAADLLGVALREECEQLESDFHSDLIL
ncbi:hypothetical protein WJX73_003955 [Symbiochloris irregularis]|uniref:Anaphase-promoting complex subunit 6 n=1 Tax=Symbiochloris irregularis TaxID=706552 RepID=A0AAW1NL33_9CHLO